MIKSYIFSSIINSVNSKGFASYGELKNILNCSESTVRRAVNELAKKGMLIKERGGVSSILISDFFTSDQNLLTREKIDENIKIRMALEARKMIKDNMTIYLDAGSSTLCLAKKLKNVKTKVVTNSFTIAKVLMDKHIDTTYIGGELKIKTDATIGPIAIDSISKFNFNCGFFGANGVTPSKGFSTPDLEEAHIKKVAIDNSNKCIFLVNSSKFNKNSIVSFAGIDGKTIITDYRDSDNKFSSANIIEV